MTRREFDNTVRDLLGDGSHPARSFVAEDEALGFDNNATALGVTQLLAEQYLVAAEALSERATENLQGLLQCDASGGAEQGCIETFVQRFGLRAYRRPLTAEDTSHLLGVYAAARQSGDVRAGVQAVLQVMLQSPAFLYRVEFGIPVDGQPALAKVGPYELASRLSYFLWGSMPDEELFAVAANGGLATAEEVEAQARRMIEDPRAHLHRSSTSTPSGCGSGRSRRSRSKPPSTRPSPPRWRRSSGRRPRPSSITPSGRAAAISPRSSPPRTRS
jgi:hypothetical protein